MIPTMTDDQRRESLAKARAARARRAAVLRSVADGSCSVADVIAMSDGDAALERMKVTALVKALPGYGEARTRSVMQRAGIADSRRLRGLGVRQRARLCDVLGGGAR